MKIGQGTEAARTASIAEKVRTVLSLLVLAGWLVFAGVYFFRAYSTKSWPTATGTITSAVQATRSGKSTSYGVEVVFSYSVNGQEYQAKDFKDAGSRSNPEKWARIFKQYEVNSRLTVYYNPDNPKDAVTDPGVKFFHFFLVGLPLFMLGFLGYVFLKRRA